MMFLSIILGTIRKVKEEEDLVHLVSAAAAVMGLLRHEPLGRLSKETR